MEVTLDIAAVLSTILWPAVILILVLAFVLAFRGRLPDLVERLAGRVTKLSAFEVSIELATVQAPPSPWSDPDISQNSEMSGGEVSSTALMTLFERIGVTSPWDDLIVDIRNGQFWLISRVFIFTVFLQAVRGVKCVLFVETKDEHHRRLIGLASPNAVRTALNAEFPWLEIALSKAMIKQNTTSLNPSLSSDIAGEIIREFIEQPEMRESSEPSPSNGWTQLGTSPVWEHTEWLTSDKVTQYLRVAFYEWDASHYVDTPDQQTDQRTRALLRRTAPFIALVNSKGEFQSLLSRKLILEQMAQQLC